LLQSVVAKEKGANLNKSVRVVALLAACGLAGCMSSGVKVDESKVSSLKAGVTSCAQAIALLGKPTNSSLESNGTRTYTYTYVQMQENAATFIPVVGYFMGGANTENSNFMMTCDAKGVLVSYHASQGGSDIGTGLVNGQKQ
jgi:hypothetical protein